MLFIMVDRVRGRYQVLRLSNVHAGIQIPVKAREVAAADFQSQNVSLAEDIARRPKVEFEFVDLSWVHELGLLLRGPITRSKDALRCPLDGVISGGGLMAEGIPFSFGGITPAHILNNDHVTMRCRTMRCRAQAEVPALLVIRGALQENRKFAIGFWSVNVGAQNDAVAHLHRHVVFDGDLY